MTPEQFTKGRSEFIKSCNKAPLNEVLGVVYDLDHLCEDLLERTMFLNNMLLSLSAMITAAMDELRSNGREPPDKMAAMLAEHARQFANDLTEESRSNLKSVINLGVMTTLKAQTKAAINARHDKKGGSRDLKAQIQEIWASGKYTSRDLCAEEEYAALGFKTLRTARDALIGTPDPNPWSAKEREQSPKMKKK